MTRDCLDKTLSLGHGHGQTGHCNWNNSGYHKCIFSIIKMLWVLSIYGIIQIYCFVLCTYNISQQKYTSAINVLQSIFTEIKNVCRGQQSMMLMEAPPGARSWTAKELLKSEAGHQSKLLLCCPINLCWLYQHQPGRVSTGTQHINTAINMQRTRNTAPAPAPDCQYSMLWLKLLRVVLQ